MFCGSFRGFSELPHSGLLPGGEGMQDTFHRAYEPVVRPEIGGKCDNAHENKLLFRLAGLKYRNDAVEPDKHLQRTSRSVLVLLPRPSAMGMSIKWIIPQLR